MRKQSLRIKGTTRTMVLNRKRTLRTQREEAKQKGVMLLLQIEQEKMMNISHQVDGTQTVLASELHKFLGVPTRFNDWIKRLIIAFEFEEGKDYYSFLSTSQAGRQNTEYILSLDMAKEISMLQRNDKGKQARRYFIECEKRLRTNKPALPKTMSEALYQAYTLAKEVEEQQEQLEQAEHAKALLLLENEQMKPLANYALALETAEASLKVNEFANSLRQAGFEIGGDRLRKWLKNKRYMMKRSNEPTNYAIERGFLEVKSTKFTKPNGQGGVSRTTLITAKGQRHIFSLFEQERAEQAKMNALSNI